MESSHEKAVNENMKLDIEFLAKGKQDSKTIQKLIKQKEKEMNDVVKDLDFETAAILRDEILALSKIMEKTAKEEPKEMEVIDKRKKRK
jgi:excinuclease UvrABC nuclease subunit